MNNNAIASYCTPKRRGVFGCPLFFCLLIFILSFFITYFFLRHNFYYTPIILRGSFGPTGTEEGQKGRELDNELIKELSIDYEILSRDLYYFIPGNEQSILRIYDIMGREIIKRVYNKQGAYRINLSKYPKGIYFINLRTTSSTISKKIIVF